MSRLALSFALALSLTNVASAHETREESAQLRIAPPMLDRARVRAALVANRRANLARFHAYRIAGVYPSNVFADGLTNVWRDQQGHFCAAATIIRASGEVELVDRIAEDDNFFRIADAEQGPVIDWILTSGLTKEELVMIQKPFRPVTLDPVEDPTTTITIDSVMRKNETARLAKLYRQIELKLVKTQRANLERAVDRLMARPDLARRLLAS